MESHARDLLTRAGASVDRAVLERRVDMRYAGQGYTVPVTVPAGPLGPELDAPLRSAFNEAYERRFGSHLETAAAEALHWRLSVHVPLKAPAVHFGQASDGDPVKGKREAYFPEVGGFMACPVYDRYRLSSGRRIFGPALIEERESTIVVGPSASVEADELGNLLISFIR
jgi:N-methylhydantoinase A